MTPWNHQYDDYLRDESRRVGTAESISFPTTKAEVIEAIAVARTQGQSITTQGARTGLVAGAVPQGGHVLNLSRMKVIGEIQTDETGQHLLTVQPGATLDEIRQSIKASGLFFPPDPTETTASIGGMVANNASGAMSYSYGGTRQWINALRVVLADGSVLRVRRGENKAKVRSFSLATEAGKAISGELPSYHMPKTKTAAGYHVADDMDLIDLFIGSEGTLGIVTEIELRLTASPQAVNGLTIFLPSEDAALTLVRLLRGEEVEGFEPIDVHPVAIEFFNKDALDLLRKAKMEYSAFEKIPALKPHFHTAINIEFHGTSDEEIEGPIMQVMEVLAQLDVSDEDTWFATNEREMEPLKAFRHATPEAVNLLIDQRKREHEELTKLGTDMSAPDEHLGTIMSMYNEGLRENDLESVIFGHIGNNHVHVNILPRNPDEYQTGRSLYLSWAERIVALGGSVSAEHGIGKIKIPFLKLMYGEEGVAEMRALKTLFDPEGMLNPGNLF